MTVAAPPMLLVMTSASINIRGGKSNTFHHYSHDSKFRNVTLHSLMVTGPTSKMVVTLSKKAERKAVSKHIMTVKYHKFPFDCLYVLIATYSKNPESGQLKKKRSLYLWLKRCQS